MSSPHGLDRYRWRLLALVFFATTINYMDRSLLTVLAPVLQYKVFHWTDRDFASIAMSFQAAYALGLTVMGAMVDRVGTRLGYAISILAWSTFGMLHAAIRPAFGWIGFVAARFGLGFAEAGNYPAAVKAVAERFTARERGLATGVFNAGSSMGAMLAPIVVPLIVSADGARWPFAFLVTGGLSAVWVVTWWRFYRAPAGPESRDGAHAAQPPRLKWRRVLPLGETWAFAVAKTTDAAWWFYSFWAGKFFYDQYGLDIRTLALPLVAIFLSADIGSITGGWASSHLIARGWSLNRARKTVLVVCAVCALPVALSTRLGTRFEVTPAVQAVLAEASRGAGVTSLAGASYGSAREFLGALREATDRVPDAATERRLVEAGRSDSLYWLAVALIALAAAAHQAWSTTIFTMVSDLFPSQATASVAGIGGTVGACTGIAANYLLGGVLAHSGPSGYFYMFLAAGTSYTLAAGVVHALTPRLAPVDPARLV